MALELERGRTMAFERTRWFEGGVEGDGVWRGRDVDVGRSSVVPRWCGSDARMIRRMAIASGERPSFA